MYTHTHPIFGSFVDLISVQFGTIHEISLYYTFADVCIGVIFVDTELLVCDVDLYALEEMD